MIFGEFFLRCERNFDGFDSNLLPRQENRLFDGGVQVRRMKFRRPRPRVSQQIIQNRLNVLDFGLDFGQNRQRHEANRYCTYCEKPGPWNALDVNFASATGASA